MNGIELVDKIDTYCKNNKITRKVIYIIDIKYSNKIFEEVN